METEGILLNQFASSPRTQAFGPLKARDLVAWATGDSSHTQRYQVSRLSIVPEVSHDTVLPKTASARRSSTFSP